MDDARSAAALCSPATLQPCCRVSGKSRCVLTAHTRNSIVNQPSLPPQMMKALPRNRVSLPVCSNAISSPVASFSTKATRANQTFPLRDGRILGYAEYGCPTGFPLLYLHGFPSSRLEASGLDALARRRGLRIISPDRPGYGLSTFQPNRCIMDWPGDVQSLVDHLCIPRFAVLGGSGGGPYSLACAHALPPERLSAVGILAGAGPWEAGHVSAARRLISLAATHTPTALGVLIDGLVGVSRWAANTGPVARWLDNWLEKQETAEKSDKSTRERREEILGMLFEAFPQGSAATVQEAVLLSHDWGFRLEDITYNKVQIWHGEKDANAPIEMIRYMAARLPHCDLREFEGETHYTLSRHLEEIISELVPEKLLQQHSTTP
ncbi:alpha/beta fold hydrolase [Aspergillus lucknowensis]|uniref:Alpha/Beta hydrolase protein n=1 Tax=Aspergillus lucknowensis TaxID=176173 RepID=A0ABR4LE50_9EURO